MAADEAVVIRVRADGTTHTAGEIKAVDRAVRGLGGGANVAVTGLRNLQKNLNLGSTASYVLRRSAFVATASIAGIGTMAVRSGLQFNASMEQNQIAFSQFLGSAQAARKELTWLTKEAAVTPFQLPQITQAARQLLAFNMGLQGTNEWLKTISDVAAGAGLGADAIDRIVLAVGQIKSKGRLQGDELLQLQELGVLDSTKLAKSLGMSVAQLTSGNAQVDSKRALRAIKSQFDDTFGGQSAKQASSFNGQLSNIRDNLDRTLGTVTKPGFEYLRDKIFPQLNSATGDIEKIFGRKDIDTAQKITLSRQVLDRRLGPFADALKHQIEAAHLPEKIGDEMGKAIPFIARRMGDAAVPAAKAFVNGWLHSGPWGMFLSAAWLGKKAGAFGALGKALGGSGGAGGGLAGRGGPTNPLYVVPLTGSMTPGGLPDGKGKGKGGFWKKAGRVLKPAALAGDIGLLGGAVVGGTEAVITGKIPGWVPGIGGRDLTDPAFGGKKKPHENAAAQRRHRALADAVRRGNLTPQQAYDTATPGRGDVPPLTHVILNVDGKILAQVVARHAADAQARRGR